MMRPLFALLLLGLGCDAAKASTDSPSTDTSTRTRGATREALAAPDRGPTDAPVGSSTSAETAPLAESPDCPKGYRCERGGALGDAPVSALLIEKGAHRLHLVRDRVIVRSYEVALGSGGSGQKLYEGDRVTPIGTYAISGRYPSRWHTYLALDYPRDEDKQRYEAAVAKGEAPAKVGAGSAIAIHGHRQDQPERLHKLVDWTLGCVALDNGEIDEIATVAPKGTTVIITP